jgi:hypothetical protein
LRAGRSPAAARRLVIRAGATRVSIDLQKTLALKMDGRVKPGHDDPVPTKKPALPPAFCFASVRAD